MMLRVLFPLMLCLGLPHLAAAGNLPTSGQGPVLRIQGSNTIGAALGPALVEGLLGEQGLRRIHRETLATANELRIVGETDQGSRVVVEVAAHGSSTGFAALKAANADLAASSRPIKDSERMSLASLGFLKSPGAELSQRIVRVKDDGQAVDGDDLFGTRAFQIAQGCKAHPFAVLDRAR